MATAGGGKMRSKRQHGSVKPYARNKGLLGRVTDNVKNLIPSWLQSYFRTDEEPTVAEATPSTPSAPSTSPSASQDPEEETERPGPPDGFTFAALNHDSQQNYEVVEDGARPSTSAAANSGYSMPFPRVRGPLARQPIDRSHSTQRNFLALPPWLPAAGSVPRAKPGDARDAAAAGGDAEISSGVTGAGGSRSGRTMLVLSGADGAARDVRDSSSQCEDDSVSTTSGFSSRASDKDVSTQQRGSTALLQPLWCVGTELPARSAPQPSAHSAKKPSFNLTVFESSRMARGLGSSQLGDSTFYPGKTTYGGASAMSRPPPRKLPAAPYQAPYRVQVKAKPAATPKLTSAVTSVTARRILQSLEKLSSPLSDALKIPSSNTSHSLSGSSYLDPVSSPRTHRLLPQHPPVQQLMTPRTAAVSRSLYRRSWTGPSRTSSPPASSTTTTIAQSALATDSTQPGTSCDNRTRQSKTLEPGSPKPLSELMTPMANGLPRAGGGGGGGGKMKRERIAVHFSAQKDDPSESDVELPSVPLPIRAGALPSFNFGPGATSTPANTRSPAFAVPTSCVGTGAVGGAGGSTDKMPFTFTTPPVKATELEQLPTSQPPPFQFSTPVTKAGPLAAPAALPRSSTGFEFRSAAVTSGALPAAPSVGVVAVAPSDSHSERRDGTAAPGALNSSKGLNKRNNHEDNDSSGGPFKAAKTLKPGSVLDILMAPSAPKAPGLGSTGSSGEGQLNFSGFGDRFRPPEGSWECNACMVQNQASNVTCVACQASKPMPKQATSPSSSLAANAKLPRAAGPSLSEQFAPPPGSWDCDTCMVSNRGESSRCVACDTPRASLAPKRSALVAPPSTPSSPATFSSGLSTTATSITKPPASTPPPPAYTKPSVAAGAGTSSLASLFARPEGAWDCEVCMVQNKADSTSCVACQTAKPGANAAPSSAVPAATLSGFGDKFKRPTGSWDCSTCMVSNPSSSDACACCSTARPGAAAPPASAQAPAQPDRPTFSFGLSSSDSTTSTLSSATATFSFTGQGGFKFGTSSGPASKDTTTASLGTGESAVTDTTDASGPAAVRGFTFGTTMPTNDSAVTFGGGIAGFKFPSSDAAGATQTSAFTFGTKASAGNSTASTASTTATVATSTGKVTDAKGSSSGTFQFGVAAPSFGQKALLSGADAKKPGGGFAFSSDNETAAAPATFGGFQFKPSATTDQPSASATFSTFGGGKHALDGAGPEGKMVPPLTGFNFPKEAAQKTDGDEPTAKKPFGFATMNPSAASTPGLFGATPPQPPASSASSSTSGSFSFGTKPIGFGVPVKPDAPAANAAPSTSVVATPPFMFGPPASVSATKPDPVTGAAPACSSAQIAPFGFTPSVKPDKPATTFLFGPSQESQQQQLAVTAANNSATPVAPFVFGKSDAGVTNATVTNIAAAAAAAAAAPPVFGAVPKTDAPAANSGVAGAVASGGSTFMFGPSAGSAASTATAAVTPFAFGGSGAGTASSSGAGSSFGSGSSSIFSAPGSSLPTFGTASSAPSAGTAHGFGAQPGGDGGAGGAPFRQPPAQPPTFGSSGPSQLAPPAFGFSANQQQVPAFGSGAVPTGGQQPLFSAAVHKPSFGPAGTIGQPAGSGSFQFSGATQTQGFNFGGAGPAPGPSGSLTFGGSPQPAPSTFQFNARPGFNIGMSGSPANQFQGSSSSGLKNRKYKTAVRRRK